MRRWCRIFTILAFLLTQTHYSLSQEDGIDLSLLTSALVPQEQVIEPDTVWEFEHLFAKLSSQFNEENEAKEGREEGARKRGGITA